MGNKKKNNKADLLAPLAKSLTGGFSATGYITTGASEAETDPYIKQEAIPSRYLGKNLMVSAARSGNLPSVYFDRIYATLASSEQNKGLPDKYEDPAKAALKDQQIGKEKQKKLHKDVDFKLAAYPKQSTGPGSFAGCFQSKPFEYIGGPKPPSKKDKNADAKKEPLPRNFQTAPARKGTYGVLGTTFGKFQSLYVMTEEMDAQRKKDVDRWEKQKKKAGESYKKLLDRPTFRAMGTSKITFDEKKATGISSVFDNYEAPEPKTKKRRQKKKKNEPKPLDLPVFRYSSPPKIGETGFFNKFANTRVEIDEADEERKRKKKARADRRKNKGKKTKPLDLPTWKPVSGPKTSVFASLLTRYS